jgi:hypothetical protein
MIWLDVTGKLKKVMGVFSDTYKPITTSSVAQPSNTTLASGDTVTGGESVIRKALKAAGFDKAGVDVMTAIGKAESSLNTAARNITSKEYSIGAFQLNLRAHPYISEADALDPYKAAKWAYQLSGGGKNFNPWTTYTSGKYKGYL